jgi:SOS-response transcriptional repressor LexA
MSFATRLKEQRERIGLTQVDLAAALGVTKGAVGNYETGASSPKAEILYQLFDILHCDANYLFQDEMRTLRTSNATPEEMEFLVKKYRALDKHGKNAVDSILNIEHNRCTEVSALPFAEVIQMPTPIQSASAGTGELADDDTIEHIPVLRNVWTSKADYALRVHGDSMEPEIYDGDMILVRSQPAVELGETGIFIRDGERYVKIYRGDYLESLNPDYDDIPLEEFSKCIGKVIGVLKPEWIAK